MKGVDQLMALLQQGLFLEEKVEITSPYRVVLQGHLRQVLLQVLTLVSIDPVQEVVQVLLPQEVRSLLVSKVPDQVVLQALEASLALQAFLVVQAVLPALEASLALRVELPALVASLALQAFLAVQVVLPALEAFLALQAVLPALEASQALEAFLAVQAELPALEA